MGLGCVDAIGFVTVLSGYSGVWNSWATNGRRVLVDKVQQQPNEKLVRGFLYILALHYNAWILQERQDNSKI